MNTQRLIAVLSAKRGSIIALGVALCWYVAMAMSFMQESEWPYRVGLAGCTLVMIGVLIFTYRRRDIIRGRVWFTAESMDRSHQIILYCLKHKIPFELQYTHEPNDRVVIRVGFIDESDLVQVKLGA